MPGLRYHDFFVSTVEASTPSTKEAPQGLSMKKEMRYTPLFTLVVITNGLFTQTDVASGGA